MREVQEELGVLLRDYKPFKIYETVTQTGTLALNTFIGSFDGSVTLNEDELLACGWFTLESVETMKDKLRIPNVLRQVREVLLNTTSVNKIVL